MTANVRCAGGGKPRDLTRWSAEAKRHVFLADGDRCGWKGERYNLTEPRFAYRQTYFGEEQSPHPAWVRALTAKPCPRCGGKVALIEAER